MTTVNNASGLYSTLGYNFNDPNGDISTLSTNTQAHLNSMPAFITSNQAQLMITSGNSPISQSNLYKNPVANTIQTMWNTANSVISIAPGMSTNSNNLINVAISLASTANSFMWHTNRLSNLVNFDGTDTTNPYYTQALSFGKIAMYITNQTDGITNTSPLLGSFTSLFIGPQLNVDSAAITVDYTTYQTGIQNDTLTITQYGIIESDMNSAIALMSTRQSADVTYYTNLKNMVNNYNTVKQFSNMGETQKYLVSNFIGTSTATSMIS